MAKHVGYEFDIGKLSLDDQILFKEYLEYTDIKSEKNISNLKKILFNKDVCIINWQYQL